MPMIDPVIDVIDPEHCIDSIVSIEQIDHFDKLNQTIFIEKEASAYFLKDKQQRFSPITIDFSSPFYRYRGGKEYLPKAFKGTTEKSIIDATAGWARDAWLMAYRGFNLNIKERNPYLVFLLEQALKKALLNPQIKTVAQRLKLDYSDAIKADFKSNYPIYIDPMYPDRKKNAKVKNPMQVLHTLLGGQEKDADDLLINMIQKTHDRVVVKRPKSAGFLAEKPADYSIHAPNTRFDIYLSS